MGIRETLHDENVLAVDTVELTLGGFLLIALIVILLAWLARHDHTTRVRFGFFLEREREKREEAEKGDDDTKVWPGQ